jgi:transposase
MSITDVLPADAGLSITAVTTTPALIALAITPTTGSACCPACGVPSDRVHSHYTRTVADLPWRGRRVVLRLTVRRYRCRTAGCIRSIFCERLPAVLAPHARTTGRLTEAHTAIGFAVGGEPGRRLAVRLAVPTSGDTLLRRVKATPLPSRPTPRVLGVDDFAFRRGKSYGTILIDLERRAVADLLPDRTAGTLAAWLRTRPGVAVVSRDRASAYAPAVKDAVPAATQVADRFHLLMNLREAVERALGRQAMAFRTAITPSSPAAADPDPPSDIANATSPSTVPAAKPARWAIPLPVVPPPTAKEVAAAGRRRLRQERFDRVRQLHRDGTSLRGIARLVHLNFLTVQRYIRAETCPRWRSGPTGRPGHSPLRPFLDWVDRAVADGCPNARALFRDLQAAGYTGGYSPVRRAVHQRTGTDRRFGSRTDPAPTGPPKPVPSTTPVPPRLPSPRPVSFIVTRRPADRPTADQAHLDRLAAGDPGLKDVIALAERFAALVRGRAAADLDPWLTDAAAGRHPEFRTLARSVTQDDDAVRAALTHAWSNGPTEGSVNRLKAIKRQMFGRAGFDLLRARVLQAA